MGDNARGTKVTASKFDEKVQGFRLGAPIVKNKLFIFGNYEEIDKLQKEIDDINVYFNDEMEKLSNFIEPNSGFVKMEYNEREGYFLYNTKKRADKLPLENN